MPVQGRPYLSLFLLGGCGILRQRNHRPAEPA
ncbi:GlyGly-CTERM sorting domain-containing protein [Nocardia sp. SYP-A9097]|nr:GlyGly-CTERM sorting domain-containing protein [Nocardia sp. SYP-A9097]